MKLKAPAYETPRDREHADKFIYDLGELHRDRAQMELEMNTELARVKAKFEADVAPTNREITATMKGLQAWCEANRAELCPRDSKTVKFGNGEVSWRFRPPKVNLRGVKKIIAWCEEHKLTKFLRVKKEIDKDAMRKDRVEAQKIKGVSIKSAGEDFIVKPFESQLDEIA
jgi:phage host-nuclease inhibitor protein Gam